VQGECPAARSAPLQPPDVREYAGWSDFQVKMHMHKLEELEYVLVHRGAGAELRVRAVV